MGNEEQRSAAGQQADAHTSTQGRDTEVSAASTPAPLGWQASSPHGQPGPTPYGRPTEHPCARLTGEWECTVTQVLSRQIYLPAVAAGRSGCVCPRDASALLPSSTLGSSSR